MCAIHRVLFCLLTRSTAARELQAHRTLSAASGPSTLIDILNLSSHGDWASPEGRDWDVLGD